MIRHRSRVCLLLVAASVAVALAACRTQTIGSTYGGAPSTFFVPAGAQQVEQHSRRPNTDIAFLVRERYPAGRFLCELAQHLETGGWHGLREDALNPGSPTSLVDGWREFSDGTRQPERHVHAWSAEWLDGNGQLLFYALRYEYPENSQPELSTLKVSAVLLPKEVVRAQLGGRAEQLSSLVATRRRMSAADTAEGSCLEPTWSEFVRSATRTESPSIGLPYEMAYLRSIEVVHDVDGLARRIADRLRDRVPSIRVATLREGASQISDGLLDFRFECRCNEPGAPNGFYIREAIVYKPKIERVGGWTEPPRVLFHWSDGGEAAWKHVPALCFDQKPWTTACSAAFQDADIAFVDALASAIGVQ